jgi:hypothetical protein
MGSTIGCSFDSHIGKEHGTGHGDTLITGFDIYPCDNAPSANVRNISISPPVKLSKEPLARDSERAVSFLDTRCSAAPEVPL